MTRAEIEATDAAAYRQLRGSESLTGRRIWTVDCVDELTDRHPGERLVLVRHEGAWKVEVLGDTPHLREDGLDEDT